MGKLYFILIFILELQMCFSQEIVDNKVVDSLYKEDQFYVGLTYNALVNKPNGIKQSGFSVGLHLGVIKDIPLNKKRDLAIGIGLGYAASSYNQNLLIVKDDIGNFTYINLSGSEINYSKNKFSNHLVEMPIEFRWRTSTPTEYKFWRVYTGVKIGYVFADKSKFKGDLGSIKYKNNRDFNNFQYGLTCSMGYNTWNFYLYYPLNNIFSSKAVLDGEIIDMKAIKVGLMFYIL